MGLLGCFCDLAKAREAKFAPLLHSFPLTCTCELPAPEVYTLNTVNRCHNAPYARPARERGIGSGTPPAARYTNRA